MYRQVVIGSRAWCDGSCGMVPVWGDHDPHVRIAEPTDDLRTRVAEALDHLETLALAGPKARRQAYGEAAEILRAALR